MPVPSAFNWWTDYGRLPQLTTKYTQSQTPLAGAVAIWRGGKYDRIHGHIGVVTGVSGTNYSTMEQNAESNRYLYRYTRNRANLLGFLIPRDNPAKPQTETKGNEQMLMIKKPVSEGAYKWRYAVMATNYWLEFVSEPTARAFETQVGGASVQVDEAFWQHCKRAAQPVASGSTSEANLAAAVNDEMARRLQG